GSDRPLLALLGIFAAAMVATIRGAGPPWGYANAFIPAMFFGGVLLALAAARMQASHPALAPALLALSVAAAPGGLVWAADRLWPRAGFALPVGYDPRARSSSPSIRSTLCARARRPRCTPRTWPTSTPSRTWARRAS